MKRAAQTSYPQLAARDAERCSTPTLESSAGRRTFELICFLIGRTVNRGIHVHSFIDSIDPDPVSICTRASYTLFGRTVDLLPACSISIDFIHIPPIPSNLGSTVNRGSIVLDSIHTDLSGCCMGAPHARNAARRSRRYDLLSCVEEQAP
ncbi:hypothetical protein EST38_g12359 [Candolleomyces aberdarensis]|uniref:Uncharacterized protein n=1 Tax=Candolleomyces aberdarensis TaxID=2316362 RepID=A0A4V1Q214_9AGAR|nr:hypothetical protein EST38_g12359 [Candolleomyces aberdarensis]